MHKRNEKHPPLQIPLLEAIEFRIEKKRVLLDPADADLCHWYWELSDSAPHSSYARRGHYKQGRKSWIWMHRVVLERKLGRALKDGEVPDHINQDTLDNRRQNLRVVTHGENISITTRSNPHHLRGAHYHKRDQKWTSSIRYKGKHIHLGTFDSELDAHEAYKKAHRFYYGELSPYS